MAATSDDVPRVDLAVHGDLRTLFDVGNDLALEPGARSTLPHDPQEAVAVNLVLELAQPPVKGAY